MRKKPVVLTTAVAAVFTLFALGVAPSASALPTVGQAALPVAHSHSVRQVTPDWVNSATVYEVNVRQFSQAGNFAAVTAALPRLKALGTDVLWLMPIFPVGKLNAKGSLGSPYAVADYQAVNPDYGTNADFKALVDAAHAAGMKIVLDWVPNHSAWDNPWITQHPDWYTHDSKGDITWPAGTDWTDVADLNYDSQGLRTAMTDALKYWVKNFDIDGYRADVAGGVPVDFWNQATTEVNKLKPLWWLAEDQSNTDLLLQSFSANYNWELLNALNHVGDRDNIMFAISGSVANYPSGTYPMNFITNHDENSWNGTEFQRLGVGLKQSAAITFVTPGIPLIYNGQEVGLQKQLAFFEKDAIDWNANKDAATWTAFYAKFVKLRKANPALHSGLAGGNLNFFDNQPDKLLAFSRSKAKDNVVFLANTSARAIKTKLPISKTLAGKYIDYATGKTVTLAAGKALSLTVKPWDFVIYSTNAAK